jgi:hypothetical protein
MKTGLFAILGMTILSISLIACGWDPDVKAVPLTPPWSQMNLPVKENAIVWASTDREFKAVHKEDKKTVLGKYVEALKAQGWILNEFDGGNANMIFANMQKGNEKLKLEFYDFRNTGVIIQKE